MPKYYVSQLLLVEASSVFEVNEDGSFKSVSPQGHEHLADGDLPANLVEIDASEALRLIETRIGALDEQEKKRSSLSGWIPVEENEVHPLDFRTLEELNHPEERTW